MLQCLKCEKQFRVGPSAVATRRYCSTACYRASDAETTIERLVREVLDQELIGYQQQHRIGRWSVDFLLGKKLVIEADGDYWHAKRPDVDRRKDADLNRRGYEVWRLPESEVTAEGFGDRLTLRLAAYQKAGGVLPPADLLQVLRPTRKQTRGARSVHGPLAPPRGEANGRAKLTEAAVLEIRASKESSAALAARYGISPSRVSEIRLGKSWAHVESPITWTRRQSDPTIVPLQRSGPLTEAERSAIRNSTAMGVDLARTYGVAPQTICNIRRAHIRKARQLENKKASMVAGDNPAA